MVGSIRFLKSNPGFAVNNPVSSALLLPLLLSWQDDSLVQISQATYQTVMAAPEDGSVSRTKAPAGGGSRFLEVSAA